MPWIDALKGFAILLVVVGHAWGGLFSAGLINNDTFLVLDTRIYAFHMPLFFLISGLFFTSTLVKTDLPGFLIGRTKRLLYPMILWTYIFILAKLAAGQFANNPIDTAELLVLPIPGRWHFWFLWALFLLHLGLGLFRSTLIRTETATNVTIVLLVLSIILRWAPWPPTLLLWMGQALFMAPYFLVGILCSRWLPVIGAKAGPVWLSLGTFCILILTVPMIAQSHVGSLVYAIALSGLCLVLFSQWNTCTTNSNRLLPALALVGESSMAIFLAHTIFSAFARELLLAVGIQSVPLHMFVATASGILIPMLMFRLARRWRFTQILGF